MDRGDIIRDLEYMRDMEMNIWREYADNVKWGELYLLSLRNTFELHVRALDYAITELKRKQETTEGEYFNE